MPTDLPLDRKDKETAKYIRERLSTAPEIGIILGSGLGGLADQIDVAVRIPYAEIPHFPRTTAVGHAGILVAGQLGGKSVVAMKGRFHLFEGYTPAQILAPVRMLARIGVQLLVVSNASGGLNPQFAAGDLCAIDSHMDLMFRGWPHAVPPGSSRYSPRDCGPRPLYDSRLIERCQAIGRRLAIPVHRGSYIGLTGPNYETRAEYRYLRRIGGDMVGMSTVGEVVCARQLGMRVLAISTITNVARPDNPEKTDHEQVVAIAADAANRLQIVLTHLLNHG